MTDRGIDQILPPGPRIYEPYMTSAQGSVKIAEEASGPIPKIGHIQPGKINGLHDLKCGKHKRYALNQPYQLSIRASSVLTVSVTVDEFGNLIINLLQIHSHA